MSSRIAVYVENLFHLGFATPVDMHESSRGRDNSIPAKCRTQNVIVRTRKYIQHHLQAKNSAVSEVDFCFIKWK
jgi:hypothetical protein